MSKKDEVLKLALEALEAMQSYAAAERKGLRICDEAITALREALAAQPAQTDWEAVAADQAMTIALLRAEQPAQRTWVGLTDEEITDIWAEASPYYHEDDFARAIEAKLKQRNT